MIIFLPGKKIIKIMKKIIYLSIIFFGVITACEKSADNNPVQQQEFVINATSSSTWKYFSFSKNDTVTIADPASSTDWDLAFQRYRIRTNGGIDGPGSGSAANSYKKQQAGFDLLRVVPDTTTFVVDTTVEIAVQQGYANYNINPALYSWFGIELGANGTQIVPTDNIYFIRSATGKYAKVWFKSYYNNSNTSGYVTFQYKYQPDGSRNIE
jgi:hypothetical protein